MIYPVNLIKSSNIETNCKNSYISIDDIKLDSGINKIVNVIISEVWRGATTKIKIRFSDYFQIQDSVYLFSHGSVLIPGNFIIPKNNILASLKTQIQTQYFEIVTNGNKKLLGNESRTYKLAFRSY